jgi:entericidin B
MTRGGFVLARGGRLRIIRSGPVPGILPGATPQTIRPSGLLIPRRMRMTRTIAAMLLVVTAALAGCNTVAGVGQDISKGGQAISDTAEKAK